MASANWLETASTGSCSSRGRFSSDFAAAGASFLALAALAKLTAGRTVAAAAALGNLMEFGVGGVLLTDELGGGVLVLSDAVREVVRDIGCEFRRSFAASRSFSTRSATSRSREDTSTGLRSFCNLSNSNWFAPKSLTLHYRTDWSVDWDLMRRKSFWEKKGGLE